MHHHSASEAVKSPALSLESIDDIHGSHGLAPGVLSVGDSVPHDVLEESLEDLPGIVVDERGNSLDTASSSESADGGLGDALDGSPAGLLSMSLDTDLSDSLASFSLASHFPNQNNIHIGEPGHL